MKKVFIIFVILIFASIAQAQTWHTANRVTLAWDAVPPVAEGDTIKYQVYVKFQLTTAAPVAAGGEINATEASISFSTEGRYYLCAQTVRYPALETEAQTSIITCSDDGANTATGIPFGVKYFVKPNGPGKLRLQ